MAYNFTSIVIFIIVSIPLITICAVFCHKMSKKTIEEIIEFGDKFEKSKYIFNIGESDEIR